MRGPGGDRAAAETVQGPVKVTLRGVLPPGATIGMHSHTETNCEVIYILSGTGQVLCDGVQEADLGPGACHYCPKGHGHVSKTQAPSIGSLPWSRGQQHSGIHRKGAIFEVIAKLSAIP